MTMLDMMFNEQEKKKMMEGFAQAILQAVELGIDRKLPAIEQVVERVLVKRGVIGSLDGVMHETVKQFESPEQAARHKTEIDSGLHDSTDCGYCSQK